MPQFVGRLIGAGILTALYGALALPLIIALLMATNRVRYRGWLAAPAFVFSLISLEMSGDYIYNLIHWTASRPSNAESILTLALVGAGPLLLIGLVLKRSPRKLLLAPAMLLLLALTGLGIQQEIKARGQSDLAEYQKGATLLLPQNGTLFAHCEVKHLVTGGVTVDHVYVEGHVPEGTRVTLLSDPFSGMFQPIYSTGTAGTYHLPASDPAVLGNVTEIGHLEGYDQTANYGLAVIERTVTRYEAVRAEPFSSNPDFSHPAVRASFQKLGYSPFEFDVARARSSRAAGRHGENLFVSSLRPLPTRPDALLCTAPALVLSVQSVERVQAMVPYCAVSWSVFELNDELYFAGIVEEPTPPGEDIMGPPGHPGFSEWNSRPSGRSGRNHKSLSARVSQLTGKSLGAITLVMLAEVLVDGLAAGEAFVDAVPPGDARLAQFPAQVDFAALKGGGKIDQTDIEVLYDAAEFLHLFDDAA
jgi:hypothetical protein